MAIKTYWLGDREWSILQHLQKEFNGRDIFDMFDEPTRCLHIYATEGFETYKIDDNTIGIRPIWIPVEQRAPTCMEKVLIFDPKFGILLGYFNGTLEWREDNGTSCGCCAQHVHPTHWMALPKSPNQR